MKHQPTRRHLWSAPIIFIILSILAACAPAGQTQVVVQTVEVEKIVEKEVPVVETVEVEKIVEVPAQPEEQTQIIYALYQEPQILNPYIATQTVSSEAAAPVVEGLLDVDPEGNRYPVLAEEVPSVENGLVNEDGTQVTYNLKQGVLWSDGKPFTCADVIHTFRSVIHPKSGAVSTTGYENITPPADLAELKEAMVDDPEATVEETPEDGGGVVCLDDHTVQVNYDTFYAPYLSLFDSILPAHATGAPADMQRWIYNWHPLGTGPYKIQEWVSGDHINYIANENYRDYPDKPLVDKLIIRIIPSREVGKALILTGEIDILWDLTEADVPEYEGNPDIVVHSIPSPGTERLVLNLADPTLDGTDDPLNNPHWALGDRRVRQAIELGIDKEFINQELLFGLAKVGTNELNNGWAKVELPPSPYDPDQAMALLEEAGWTDEDGDDIRECHGCLYGEEGQPLSMKYQTTTGNQLREETEQVIIEMMAEIGIELYVENVPSSVLFGSWASGAFRKHGNFDIVMYTTNDGVDPQSQIEGYFASSAMPTEANAGAGFNYSRWVNEEADELIALAGSSPDIEVRKDAYRQIMELISADLPHIYLYDRAEINLTRSHIQNFQVNPWAAQTWNVEDWAIGN